MTDAAIRAAVLRALATVAPEVDPAGLEPDRPLRDQVDIDSYDYLRFVVAIADELGVEIPEGDYDKVTTPGQLIGYLAARCA